MNTAARDFPLTMSHPVVLVSRWRKLRINRGSRRLISGLTAGPNCRSLLRAFVSQTPSPLVGVSPSSCCFESCLDAFCRALVVLRVFSDRRVAKVALTHKQAWKPLSQSCAKARTGFVLLGLCTPY
uniref:Uncharacterized protein n=1 Tax=Steinernema glaseri TaxID=37863 RepID=A0A1I7Y687_9BILA